MQTCSKCNTENNDANLVCSQCQADLTLFSTVAVSLAKFQANPRVRRIVLAVYQDACPSCKLEQGTYEKDQVPPLPHKRCSHKNGCRCFYEPVLSEIYP